MEESNISFDTPFELETPNNYASFRPEYMQIKTVENMDRDTFISTIASKIFLVFQVNNVTLFMNRLDMYCIMESCEQINQREFKVKLSFYDTLNQFQMKECGLIHIKLVTHDKTVKTRIDNCTLINIFFEKSENYDCKEQEIIVQESIFATIYSSRSVELKRQFTGKTNGYILYCLDGLFSKIKSVFIKSKVEDRIIRDEQLQEFERFYNDKSECIGVYIPMNDNTNFKSMDFHKAVDQDILIRINLNETVEYPYEIGILSLSPRMLEYPCIISPMFICCMTLVHG